ncbi:uncharacterized protein TNCV_4662931 [Trichonephila clavipes]|uniref:Uncharacterized protein n=1 Tax=Trichonephila clavipes TaxID=2585209 RepID=A0A8X6SH49_TRICX|nr:uncharacterized protein TNCV_4662931 [Trichonephila clavipes]
MTVNVCTLPSILPNLAAITERKQKSEVMCDDGKCLRLFLPNVPLTESRGRLRFHEVFMRESFRLTASRVARDKPWSTLCKKSHGISSSPRAAAVAKFRLLTGHDCLCAHLFRFNLVTSPICVLCDTGQDKTAAHLDECSALNDLNCIVKRYWRARCLMT